MTLLRLLASACLAACLVGAAPARAADWPTKPVRLVYNFPAGSGGDAVTRHLAEALAQKLGQPFVVENRAGASGTVGAEAVAKSTPDGYTFLTSPNAPMVLVPQLRKVGYSVDDLVPVSALGEYVYGWTVLPKMGVKTIAEFVALAKTKPGILTYATPGAGSATNLRQEAFNNLAGIEMIHVPYRAGNDAIIDFMAGRVDLMIDYTPFPYVKKGDAVMLAVTTKRRHPDFPDVPTIMEAGYPIELPAWLGVYAIKGTPADATEKLGQAVREVAAQPDFQQRLITIGFFPMTEGPAEMKALHAAQIADFSNWVKKLNFKIE